MEKIERIEHDDPAIQGIIDDGWKMSSPNKRAMAEVLGWEDDPNHQKLLQVHASHCKVCSDIDGFRDETEQAWMLGGYNEVEAARVMDVATWEWRLHVRAEGLHHTRNQYRDQIRSEMLYTKPGEHGEAALTHKERMDLMRDLDKADGIGNPQVIKQVIEYKKQTLNINGASASEAQRLIGGSRYDDMSDDDLQAIMDIIDRNDE